MTQQEILELTEKFVKKELELAEAGHNWWHIKRVLNNINLILEVEKADSFICQLAALLHDIADRKFNNNDEKIRPDKATAFLKTLNIDTKTVEHIANIIRYVSYSSSFESVDFNTKELQVVQDADRLDAIGAIGIARAFHYGGYKNHEIYNPEQLFKESRTKEEYIGATNSTIQHFYDKLLKIKDMMNTDTARNIAVKRHQFMEEYLYHFYAEWDGIK